MTGTIEALEPRVTHGLEAESHNSDGPGLTAKSSLLAATGLLAACGGGGDGSGSPAGGGGSPTPAPTPPTAAQASRLLAQATMGATRASIDAVVSRGITGWVDDQLNMTRGISHWQWLVDNGYAVVANRDGTTGFDPSMWRSLIVEPDQLRQRVGMALLDMLVVGIEGINLSWRQFAMAAYVDVLLDNAFGNFRTLMGAMTTNAAMASFVTYLGNRRARNGSVPDENYAREILQLFTIGLYQLEMDGSVKQVAGKPVETYTQADVAGLARVFTGLSLANNNNDIPDRYRMPLVMNAGINETGTANFLGTSTTGGGMAAINTALDTIFAHPNVAPFISKQLIQRLVTSNPTPAYINRIANVFANNGAGVRGDLKAVVRAILLDVDARSDAAITANGFGKLREPVMRLTGWARAFGVTSPTNTWAFGDTSSQSNRLGQSFGRSPTVFNFFRPGYSPPNTAISTAGLVAPEFQITNEQSVVGYVNYMNSLVANGAGDTKADYTTILTKAADPAALVDEVNLILAAGQLSAATVTAIRTAVESVSATATNSSANRVGIAILLTLASPDFLTVR